MLSLRINRLSPKRLFFSFLFVNFVSVVLPNSTNTTASNGRNQTASVSTIGFRVNLYIIIFVSSFAMIANGVLLMIFAIDPLRCLRNVASALIINLTLADFLTGAMILLWSTGIWHWLPLVMKNLVFSTIWLGYSASFLTIALLSCERYIAIRYIWSADRIVTKKRTLYAIVTIWLLSSFSFFTLSKSRNTYIASFSGIIEVCILIVVVFYVKLWRLRRKHCQRESTMAIKQEMKLTVVVFLLVIVLIITSLPLMILYQLLLLYSLVCGIECNQDTLRALPLLLFPLFTLNFGLNPIIYGWRLPKYRRSFYLLFSMVFQNIPFKRKSNNIKIFNRRHNRRSTAVISQLTSSSCTSL